MIRFDLRVTTDIDAFSKLIASLQFQGATFRVEQEGLKVKVILDLQKIKGA